MVVHDLRNPTNQINFIVEQTLINLKELMTSGYIFNKKELKNDELQL